MHLLFRQHAHCTSLQVSLSVHHLLRGRILLERRLIQRIGTDQELSATVLLEL